MTGRSLPATGAACALLALPLPARAAEGGLEVFPDWFGTLPALVVLYVLLILPAHKLLFQPLLRVLDERRQRIEGARAKAEGLSVEADGVLGRYEAAVQGAREQAEAHRREALDRARHDQAQRTSRARNDAEQEVSRARGEVTGALSEARAQLRREAELLAREAASQVLGRSLS